MTETQRAEARTAIARGEGLRAKARELGVPESTVLGLAYRDRQARTPRAPPAARVNGQDWEARLQSRRSRR